jgi:hypothetical protein
MTQEARFVKGVKELVLGYFMYKCDVFIDVLGKFTKFLSKNIQNHCGYSGRNVGIKFRNLTVCGGFLD